MQEAEPPLAFRLRERRTGEVVPAPAEVAVVAGRVGGPDVLRDHVGQEVVSLLALALPREETLGANLVGDVFDAMNDVDQVSAIIEDGRVQRIPVPFFEGTGGRPDVVLLECHAMRLPRPQYLVE